jgi:hypothetical protein
MKNGISWEEPHGVTSQKTPFFKNTHLSRIHIEAHYKFEYPGEFRIMGD